MSITVSSDVFCDGRVRRTNKPGEAGMGPCVNWTSGVSGPTANAKDARAEAKAAGWKRIDGKDLCPTCAARAQARRDQ